jgi:hypothetical protein
MVEATLMMNRLPQSIKSTVPNELVPAVEALNETLNDSHFKCGKITEVYCYSLLRPGENLTETEQYKLALIQLKVIAGPAATEACHHRIRMGTGPAFFHAMNQLYIAGVTAQAIQVFHDLLAIGKANAEYLEKMYIQWAHDLTLELIEIYENRVKLWIRAVCDPPDYSTDLNWKDPDEIIMGKTWCAPMLLVMQPSRSMPFDAARQWERVDRETSKQWLNSFAEMFTIQVKTFIDRLAGEKTVEFAKQPKPALEPRAKVADTDASAQMNPGQDTWAKMNVKQEYRRRKTDERNRKIRSEFKRLEKRRPGMSGVWYSQQLANSEFADGLDAETIRKIIRG